MRVRKEGNVLDPVAISAQFAAFVWFTNDPAHAGGTHDAAMEFSRRNWQRFLPLAHRGLGRLLLKIANMPRRQPRKLGRPGADVRFSCN
jgi:hypothetical protein